MKFLLTSSGLVNESIKQAFLRLSDKPASELTVAFIPTAKNRNNNDKRYFQRVLNSLDSLGVGNIDWVDIAAIDKQYWLPRLEAADIIYVGGGNTYYLMDQVNRSGLREELPKLLVTRGYCGDSAGAIIVTPSINIAEVDDSDDNIVGLADTAGLGLVPFEVSPHTPEDVSLQGNEDYALKITNKLYAFDNNTAIFTDGEAIEYVGGGQYWEFG